MSGTLYGLTANHITKNIKRRRVVNDVSLAVRQGEIVGLLGPNGAGKSTLFCIVAGLLLPDYGSIVLDQKDITNKHVYQRARLGIGYLPQDSSTFHNMTVYNNILAVLELKEPDKKLRNIKTMEILEEFQLSHLADIGAEALSGGERRRLEIARCIACNPRFILLDEPLAGVDPLAGLELKKLIRKLRSIGIGILLTDHNVHTILDLLDRVYIMYQGSILIEGDPQTVSSNKQVIEMYLGERNTQL